MSYRTVIFLGSLLMRGLNGSLRFKKQASKYDKDFFRFVVVDSKTGKLYRIQVSETDISQELPLLNKSKDQNPIDI